MNQLHLISFTRDLVSAAIQGQQSLEKKSGYHVSANWPNPDYAEILPYIEEQLINHPSLSDWSMLIVHQLDKKVIGEIGGKGGPDENGAVEIGYGIVPEYQGKGFATEAVKDFVAIIQARPGIKKIKADCLHENIASTRVLEKAGFRIVNQDDELIYWELMSTTHH